MPFLMVRRFCLLVALVVGGLLAGAAYAETFKFNNGETLTGEVLTGSANDAGVQIKVGEGEYKHVPWTSFSQEDLKNFAKDKRMEPLVEPFIEITQAEKLKKPEVKINASSKLRAREITATQLTRDCLDRIARAEPRLHAFITVCENEALEQERRADAKAR